MRIRSLDGLRGVAALVVVLHHGLLTLHDTTPGWAAYSPVRLATAGRGAVMIFFALSGYVLMLSLKEVDRFGRRPFLIKRAARIYLPFAAAILISAGLYLLVRPQPIPELSEWFNRYSWTEPPGLGLLAGHLAMTDSLRLQSLDNVMWSLVHEMRVSLIFPLLGLALVRNWRIGLLAALLVSLLANAFVITGRTAGWTYDPVATAVYLFLFAGGAVLYLKADAVSAAAVRLPSLARWAALLAAWLAVTQSEYLLNGLPVWLGALSIVALAAAEPGLARLLTGRVVLWLGKVSYSLYLLHVPVLLTLVHLLHGRLPMPAVLALALAVSLAAAELANRLVERPAMKLGRALAA